jgi:VCBS repeat-containing protein
MPTFISSPSRVCIMIAFSLLASACGFVDSAGSGVNQPPDVDVSENQTVTEQTTVVLTSSVVDDFENIKSYMWKQVSGSAVLLHGAETSVADFVAPVVTIQEGPQVLRFTLTVTDNFGEQSVGTVNITVNPVNALPVANNDSVSTSEDLPVSINVIENDIDNDDGTIDPATVKIVDHPANGAVEVAGDGSVLYTPAPNFFGSDVFSYTVNDNEMGTSNVAQVSALVNPVNDAPVAINDPTTQLPYTLAEGESLSRDAADGVLVNDIDLENDALSAILVSGPSNASSFKLGADGSFSYTHDGSETTTDSFTYRAGDGNLASNVATANITISAVNDTPTVIPGQAFDVDENSPNGTVVGTVKATDAEGDNTITGFTIAAGNTDGAFAISPAGELTVNNTAALDFESHRRFNLSITATDGVNTSVAENVTISLNDLDEVPPKVTLSTKRTILVEGQSSKITVSLDKEALDNIDVTIGFSGSASDTDYNLNESIENEFITQSGIVTLTPGSTSADFNIDTVRDSDSEPGGETIIIKIVKVKNGVENGSQQLDLDIYDGTTSCADILAGDPTSSDGVYTVPVEISDPPTIMNIYCDMSTDGGGWTLVLNYLHSGGTNPALDVKPHSLPLLGNATLGVDESGDNSLWGHASNALLNNFDFSEVRFFGKSSGHNRVIHFKTDHPGTVDYFKSGIGTMDGFGANVLVGHTAYLPASADSFSPDKGDFAMTEAPFFEDSNAFWNIKGSGQRWEVDDNSDGFANDTLHRIWIR